MAGNALPFVLVEDPRIGKPSDVVVRLALIRALGVIYAGNDGSVAEEVHLHILNVRLRRLEAGISDIGEEFLLVAEFAVPLRVNEAAGNQGVKSSRVAIDLRFVPQVLKNHEFALARISLLRSQTDRAES